MKYEGVMPLKIFGAKTTQNWYPLPKWNLERIEDEFVRVFYTIKWARFRALFWYKIYLIWLRNKGDLRRLPGVILWVLVGVQGFYECFVSNSVHDFMHEDEALWVGEKFKVRMGWFGIGMKAGHVCFKRWHSWPFLGFYSYDGAWWCLSFKLILWVDEGLAWGEGRGDHKTKPKSLNHLYWGRQWQSHWLKTSQADLGFGVAKVEN